MSISTPEELSEAVAAAGSLLQEIQNYCAATNQTHSEFAESKVRFPRGYIRSAAYQRKRIPFVSSKALKDNIAYTMILSDTILWLQLRTDLWGTPNEMLTKLYAFLIGSICESLTKDYLSGVCGKGYKVRNEYPAKNNIISPDLKDDLDWLWDIRNNMHLFMLNDREYDNNYDHQCHMRCVRTFRNLLTALASARSHS